MKNAPRTYARSPVNSKWKQHRKQTSLQIRNRSAKRLLQLHGEWNLMVKEQLWDSFSSNSGSLATSSRDQTYKPAVRKRAMVPRACIESAGKCVAVSRKLMVRNRSKWLASCRSSGWSEKCMNEPCCQKQNCTLSQSRAHSSEQFGKIGLVRWRERRPVMQHICRTEGKSLWCQERNRPWIKLQGKGDGGPGCCWSTTEKRRRKL